MRPRCTKRKGFYNLSHANFAGLAVAQQFQGVKNLLYFTETYPIGRSPWAAELVKTPNNLSIS
jgi:hypothetical protein